MLPSPPQLIHGDANQCIEQIVSDIPQSGALTLVFADPYGLHFDFETVKILAGRRCDLIVLLADNMDALRNWAKYYKDNPNSNLDRFMGEPGWRDVLEESPTDRQAEALRDRYCERLKSVGFKYFGWERVLNDRKRDIYTPALCFRESRWVEVLGESQRDRRRGTAQSLPVTRGGTRAHVRGSDRRPLALARSPRTGSGKLGRTLKALRASIPPARARGSCPLPTAHCPRPHGPTAPRPTAHCPLPIAHCPRPTAPRPHGPPPHASRTSARRSSSLRAPAMSASQRRASVA